MGKQDDLRKDITKRILAGLSETTAPWRKPWVGGVNSGTAVNIVSKNAYRGINFMLLNGTQYHSKWWGTFKQWKEKGFNVKKGEKSTRIVFYKSSEGTVEDKDGNEETRSFFYIRYYFVFNVEQCEGEGIEEFKAGDANQAYTPDYQAAKDLINALPANIDHGSDRASYILPPEGAWPNHDPTIYDRINMPNLSQFEHESDYWHTLFHELSHWCEIRLGIERDSYAYCELVADIAASMMMSELNLPQSDDFSNQQAYLNHWIEHMNNDERYIMKASSQASKVCDYLLEQAAASVAA